MRIRLLSRASELATLQARLVSDALRSRWPSLEVDLSTRSSAGDRDRHTALWQAEEKGLFTQDLSQALIDGSADAVVHSWKDLPVAPHPGTTVAATLERADPRDVLLLRRDVVDAAPSALRILTSSPRRSWQIGQSLAPLLPWPVATVATVAVRGNIPTRLAKLVFGEGHGLVVAKAALDRLLSTDADAATASAMRTALAECRWMALPINLFPTAPAQGALAVEVALDRTDVVAAVATIDHAPTRRAVLAERAVLTAAGGGCHEAIGATVRERDYGTITSVRGQLPSGHARIVWSLDAVGDLPPMTDEDHIWPRRAERQLATRQRLGAVTLPADASGLLVARAEAWPQGLAAGETQVVWAAGVRTWEKLAAQGVWVHGCAEGLGDEEAPAVDALAGGPLRWYRLTHNASDLPDAVATYAVSQTLPDSLAMRTHFFWTSGSQFRAALERYPQIRDGWHASGPGRTARIIRETLDTGTRRAIWLDYEQWLLTVLR